MANANDTDEPIEHQRRNTESLLRAPVAVNQRQQGMLALQWIATRQHLQ